MLHRSIEWLAVRLTIAQLATFVADFRRLRLNDEDLQALESVLMDRPDAGAVIPGAGGFRKLRFAPPSWGRGKSGAIRVIYAHFPELEAVVLFLMYGKNEQGNLTAEEKQAAKHWMQEFKRKLKNRTGWR